MEESQKQEEEHGIEIRRQERNLVDVETGEPVHVDEIRKCVGGGVRQFWKLYLTDFLAVLGIFDSKQLDVFIYIADNTNPANNLFIGSQEDISKAVGCSKTTVNTIMGKLQKQGFVTKVKNAVYFVNPNILMKGNDNKRQMLITWELNDFSNNDTIAMLRGKRQEIPQATEMQNANRLLEEEKESTGGQA